MMFFSGCGCLLPRDLRFEDLAHPILGQIPCRSKYSVRFALLTNRLKKWNLVALNGEHRTARGISEPRPLESGGASATIDLSAKRLLKGRRLGPLPIRAQCYSEGREGNSGAMHPQRHNSCVQSSEEGLPANDSAP
jgi:hypothetical protein